MPTEPIRRVSGTAVPVRGNSIDTDRIIPARFLRSVSFEGLEDHLFADDRALADAQGPGTHPLSNPSYHGASILLVNANFGCGSSREHAPQAIRRWGIRAILGESFAEIFFGNSIALGIPCVSAPPDNVALVMNLVESSPATIVTLDIEALTITAAGRSHPVTLPPAARESFLNGAWDATGLLLERFEEVQAVAEQLPYMRWS
jgi:3-isopropylmalate/(R)-2-methylmalate dehydratase small subunit